MLWIYLFGLLAACVVIYALVKCKSKKLDHWDRWDSFEAFTYGGMMLFCGALLITMIVAFLSGGWAGVAEISGDTHDILTMQDNQGASGSFFLGSGAINGEMYYAWYERGIDGQLVPYVEPHYNCTVFDDSEKPTATHFRFEKYRDPVVHHLLWDAPGSRTISPQYEIHIPPNSIQTGVKLDAQ